MAAALMMCLPMCMTSCNNSDDETPTITTSGSAVVGINTATLFDKLGITDLITEKLAEGDLRVTDSVLVYNQQGALVARLGAEATTLKNVTISLSDLPQGTYTIVAWQTTSNGPEPFWQLMGAEQLATVRLIQAYPSSMGYSRAIGMFTTTVTIGSEAATLNAEIAPMGSIVDISMDGFTDACDYRYVSLALGDEEPGVDGFYLDPARSGEDRWVLSTDRKDADRPIGGVLPSSSSPVESKVFTLSHGENKVFALHATDKTTRESEIIIKTKFTMEPGTVATFYFDFNKLNYQPSYCGLTKDFAAWKAERDDKKLVSDPCVQWGANLQTVHDHVASKQLWWMMQNEELLQESDSRWSRRYYLARCLLEAYFFDTEDGRSLSGVYSICFDPTVPTEVAFAHVVKQGYEPMGAIAWPDDPETYYPIFLSADGQTEVTIETLQQGGWQIYYQPTDPNDLPLIVPAFG